MRQQIAIVEQRGGNAAAREYAARTLRAYRGAAQLRHGDGRRHFAHDRTFRQSFVAGICEIREYLRRTRLNKLLCSLTLGPFDDCPSCALEK